MFLTELHYPVTGSGNEVFGNGDGNTEEVFILETLQNGDGWREYSYHFQQSKNTQDMTFTTLREHFCDSYMCCVLCICRAGSEAT